MGDETICPLATKAVMSSSEKCGAVRKVASDLSRTAWNPASSSNSRRMAVSGSSPGPMLPAGNSNVCWATAGLYWRTRTMLPCSVRGMHNTTGGNLELLSDCADGSRDDAYAKAFSLERDCHGHLPWTCSVGEQRKATQNLLRSRSSVVTRSMMVRPLDSSMCRNWSSVHLERNRATR